MLVLLLHWCLHCLCYLHQLLPWRLVGAIGAVRGLKEVVEEPVGKGNQQEIYASLRLLK